MKITDVMVEAALAAIELPIRGPAGMRKALTAALSVEQEPVGYQYRWKLDGEWTNWRVSDASQKANHLKDLEERPLYAAPVSAPSRDDVVRECIAVVEQNVLEFTNRERCIAALRSLILGDTSK